MMRRSLIAIIVVVSFLASCNKDESDPEPCGSPVDVNLGNDTTIIDGSSLILDAGVEDATYLWSTGEKTKNILVYDAGTYWVEVSSCSYSGSDSIEVFLNYRTIKVETDFGDFRMWLYLETPQHRENFFLLTNQEFFNGLLFHRVQQDFVIQGGDPDGTGFGGPGYTIPAEIEAGLNHVYGAVGAARLGDDVNPEKESNGSQFYIVCDQQGESILDGNYTVFGYVFSGLSVVYDISLVPVDVANNHRPIDDVIMNEVSIDYYTAEELETNFGFVVP